MVDSRASFLPGATTPSVRRRSRSGTSRRAWDRPLHLGPFSCRRRCWIAGRRSDCHFPGCFCIAIPLVRNTLCQFVCSATSRASAPIAFATRASVEETYGAVNFVLPPLCRSSPFFESHNLGGHIAAGCPSGMRGSGPDGGCDGQRGNACVLTEGMNPANRLAGDASAIPQWSPPTDR